MILTGSTANYDPFYSITVVAKGVHISHGMGQGRTVGRK